MKNTWKGIKSKVYLQKLTNKLPKLINFGNETVTDLQIIANTFNSFFYTVVPEVQSEVPFSYKTIFEYLTPSNQDSIFISKEEIIKIFSAFKPSKSAGPSSILTKVLCLLKDDILDYLSIIFNI